MSIGVKTANGDVKIHSVHVVPAAGFYTTRQIVENLETYADVQQSLVPAFTLYSDGTGYSGYTRIGANEHASIYLTATGYSNGLKNVSTKMNAKGASFNTRYSQNGIYPTNTAQSSTLYIEPPAGMHMRFKSNKITSFHPALTERYAGLNNNVWCDFTSEIYKFSDLFTLTDATENDYIVTVINSAGKFVLVYSGNSAPIFEQTSTAGVYRAVGITNHTHNVSNLMSTDYIGKQSVSYTTEQAAYYANLIVNATFDMYDNNGNLLFEKNADITDFVATT